MWSCTYKHLMWAVSVAYHFINNQQKGITMRKNKIKFDRCYDKLGEYILGDLTRTGKLLSVDKVFREWVTPLAIVESMRYEGLTVPPELPKGPNLLLLTFRGEGFHPFLEIRKYTTKSFNSYSAKVGEEYQFVVEEKKEAESGKK